MEMEIEEAVSNPTQEDIQYVLSVITPSIASIIKSASESIEGLHPDESDIVYHYTDIGGLLGIIEKGEMWASAVGYLNDASEFIHGRQLFAKVASGHAHRFGAQITSVLDTWPEEKNDNFVACLTLRGDQLGQWRGYANDGQGYAIGFSAGELAKPIIPSFCMNVIYDEEKKNAIFDNILESLHRDLPDLITDAGIGPFTSVMEFFLAFTVHAICPFLKDGAFVEEAEYRLVTRTGDPINDVNYRPRKGLLVPYIPIAWEGGKAPVREIIVGPSLQFEKAAWSLRQLLKKRGYGDDIKIRASSIPYSTL